MKVRELLANKSKWTRGAMARDKFGTDAYEIGAQEPVSFCLLGALERCYLRSAPSNEWKAILERIASELSPDVRGNNSVLRSMITCWNDRPGRTFEEVKTLVDKLDI